MCKPKHRRLLPICTWTAALALGVANPGVAGKYDLTKIVTWNVTQNNPPGTNPPSQEKTGANTGSWTEPLLPDASSPTGYSNPLPFTGMGFVRGAHGITAVPEPATWLLLGIGLAGLLGCGFRRRDGASGPNQFAV